MALVQCGECGKQISDAAASCPQCGAPTGRKEAEKQRAVVTTQQTSKKLKTHFLLAIGLIVLGIMIAANASKESAPIGVLMAVAGAIFGGVTKVRTWWHHG